jgi:hypothetical protein
MIEWRRESILDVYNLVAGASLVLSPWLIASNRTVMGENAFVSGALIVALSVAALVAFAEWQEWLVLILGLWLVASPWVLGAHGGPATRFNVGAGALVVYLAAIEVWLIHYESSPTDVGRGSRHRRPNDR